MQYHRDGFIAGDPDLHPAAPGHRRAGDPLPQTVDVLIAGSGPAGLCLAAQLAARAADPHDAGRAQAGPMEKGQADGISVRTMEMFQAFGFAEKVMRESVWINETTFWAPGRARAAEPRRPRAGRARWHLGDAARADQPGPRARHVPGPHAPFAEPAGARLRPEGGSAWQIDRAAADYPVTVTLEHTAPGREGQTRTVRAKLRHRLRRRALDRARRHRRRAARRCGAPGLGRDGRAGRHRLPRHADEVLRSSRRRRHS